MNTTDTWFKRAVAQAWASYSALHCILYQRKAERIFFVETWLKNRYFSVYSKLQWEQIVYGEFDGGHRKRVLVKIIGE